MDNESTRSPYGSSSGSTGSFAEADYPETPDLDFATGDQGFGATADDFQDFAASASSNEDTADTEASHGQEQSAEASDKSGGTMAKVDAGIDKAAGGIDKLVGAIRDKGDELNQSSGAVGTVGSVATAAADKLETASQYLQQTDAERLLADLESFVRNKPTQSLLAAAGVGFLLAKALR